MANLPFFPSVQDVLTARVGISLPELKTVCFEQNVPLVSERFEKFGDDHVVVGNPERGYVLYNVYKGTFFGKTPEGLDFTSESPEYIGHQWFDDLRRFFHLV